MSKIKKVENQPKKSDKNWLAVLLIVGVVTIIASIIVNLTSQEPVPIQENTWNFVTPGFKFNSSLQKKLGEPLEVRESESGKEYHYKSPFIIHNNIVGVSEDNNVKFIKEYLSYDPEHTLELYSKSFGEPQLILNYPQIGNSVRAHVFLDKGLVIIAHIADNSVEIKLYFESTSKDNFLKSWGEEFPDHESLPEVF